MHSIGQVINYDNRMEQQARGAKHFCAPMLEIYLKMRMVMKQLKNSWKIYHLLTA